MHKGLFGRTAGTVTGFTYSDAMKNSGIVWSEQTLDQFLQGPRKMVMLGEATHYDLYGQERDRALQLSVAWFDKYLKPAPAQATGKRKDPERGACNPPPLPPAGEEKKEGSGVGHKAPSTTDRFN